MRKIFPLIMIALAGALALAACSGDATEAIPSKELLNVTADTVFDANSTTPTIPVRANCRWTVELEKGWTDLKVVTKEGSGNGLITLEMEKNDQTAAREGILRVISSSGVVIRNVAISQRGIDPYIEVSKSTIEETFEGGEQIITIRSNAEWEIVSDGQPGFSCSTQEGSGNGSVSFRTEENMTEEERSSVFTIRTKDDGVTRQVSATVTVTQKARTIEISVQPTYEIAVVADGGAQVISVTCTDKWQVTGGADGFSCDLYSGERNGQVKITVEENMYETERTATFVFTTVETSVTKSAEVTLRQAGKQVTVAVGVGSMTAQAMGGALQVPVLCNAAWVATSSDSWIQVQTPQGEGDGTVVFNCSQNTATSPRSGKIIVMAGSQHQYRTEIVVEQQPGSAPTVEQPEVSEVGKYGATVSFGYQSSTSTIIEYGVCYAKHESPTIADEVVRQSGNDTGGNVQFQLTGLESGTTYWVRSFARNATGITYGEQFSFTTTGSAPGEDDNQDPVY